MLVQTKLFAPPATTPEAEMQQKMMKYMMVFMGFMFYKVPSGLGIYFITSSLWAIGERLLLPKVTHAPRVPGGTSSDDVGEDKGTGRRGGKGGLNGDGFGRTAARAATATEPKVKRARPIQPVHGARARRGSQGRDLSQAGGGSRRQGPGKGTRQAPAPAQKTLRSETASTKASGVTTYRRRPPPHPWPRSSLGEGNQRRASPNSRSPRRREGQREGGLAIAGRGEGQWKGDWPSPAERGSG